MTLVSKLNFSKASGAAAVSASATTSSASTVSAAAPAGPVSSTTTTLHYGGALSSTNRLARKPDAKHHFRTLKRLETSARLENAGIPEIAAAAMLTISLRRLQSIKSSPDYLKVRMQITHGIIIDAESQLDLIKSQRKEMLAQLLPSAFQVLANELNAKATTITERKHQVDVARDIMDREGTFAKVSRAEIKPVDAFDFERMDEASRSIINTIRGIAAPATPIHAAAAVEVNNEFSNSHTLSQVDQQSALDKLEAEAAMLEALSMEGPVN